MSEQSTTGPRQEDLGPSDEVRYPDHYRWIPGIECKDVVRHFPFMLGNAIKYIWRAGRKGNAKLKDLRKARECIDDEIRVLEANSCKCQDNYPRVKGASGAWVCTHCGRPDNDSL